MPRDRKAVKARKKQEKLEEISKQNGYGHSDPTAYQAIKNITREEQKKQAASRP